MSRYVDPRTQYQLNNGDLAVGGLLYFYVNLDYLTPKDTFNAIGALNPNPVPLDGEGRVPEINGSGIYSVRFTSSDGVTQWTVDNYEFPVSASISTLTSPMISGNITFLTPGARILGLFGGGGTASSNAAIQTTAVNSGTLVSTLPNGTGNFSSYNCYNQSDPTNASFMQMNISSVACKLIAGRNSAAPFLPIELWTSEVGRLSVDASGNFSPITDNAYSCGKTSFRFTSIWAANGTIQTSDERTKKDILPSSLGLDFINALEPVSYKFKVGQNEVTAGANENSPPVVTPRAGEREHWGLIAQQVKEAADAAGVDFGGWILTDKDDINSQQGLRYDQFISPLIKAVQELSSKNESLESRIEAIEAMLAI